jgi:4-coumarate--CoA ligase
MNLPIYTGIKTVVLPNFALDVWCKIVQDHKITYGYVVPPILLALSKSPVVGNYDLTSIKVLMSAAAPLTKEVVLAVWNRLKIPVTRAYGLTETSPATHIQVFQYSCLLFEDEGELTRIFSEVKMQ